MITSGQFRVARALLGWSQAEMAKRLQLSQATVMRWEAGGMRSARKPISTNSVVLARVEAELARCGVTFALEDGAVVVRLAPRQ